MKKEAFKLDRLASYLSKKEFKEVRKLVKKGEVKITTEKLPISFLITGEDLIPQLSGNDSLNRRIQSRHFSKIRSEFSTRAFDVLPNFIAPELVGLSVEKRAATALLFSENLKILLIKHGKQIIDFLSQFEVSSAKRDGSFKEGFDFVFRSKKPHASPLLVYEPSEVRKANLDFIKDYVSRAKELSVNVPKGLDMLITEFVRLRMGSESFANSVRELAKSLARVEMRSKLLNKDLARAFEIASASVRK